MIHTSFSKVSLKLWHLKKANRKKFKQSLSIKKIKIIVFVILRIAYFQKIIFLSQKSVILVENSFFELFYFFLLLFKDLL